MSPLKSDRERWAPSLNPRVLNPYSVQWRHDLTTHWVLIIGCDSHDDARREAKAALEKFGGQVRITTQHVVEVMGLWTGEEAA